MYGYNYGYGGFQQSFPQPQPTFQQQQQTPANGDDRIWVQGENAAKSYLVAAGSTVALWDSEKQRIYLKSVAGNGFPSMQVLNYTVENNPAPAPMPTTDNKLEERVQKLEAAFAEFRKGGETSE